MTLSEARTSTDDISFSALMDGVTPADIGGPTIPQYCELILRGGWPDLVTGKIEDQGLFLDQYLESVALIDFPDEEWAADPTRMRLLLRALARNTSTEATKAKIGAKADLSAKTLDGYLAALRRVFILEEQPAWATSL